MSAEAVVIKRLAKSLQEIAGLSEMEANEFGTNEFIAFPGDNYAVEVNKDIKLGLDYAANIAREALKGIVVT
jgi:hypothetical protein